MSQIFPRRSIRKETARNDGREGMSKWYLLAPLRPMWLAVAEEYGIKLRN